MHELGTVFKMLLTIKSGGERAQRIQLNIDFMFIFSEYYSLINIYHTLYESYSV